MKLGEVCGNITALLSAHQSIGVPQPLLLYGTDEQKQKHLPRFGKDQLKLIWNPQNTHVSPFSFFKNMHKTYFFCCN